jgi:GTP-binding protein
MIDYVRLKVKAGNGGSGAVSFAKQKRRSLGPPDGGDGGDGGDGYLFVDKNLTTLLPYRYKKDFKATDGARGAENHKRGQGGSNLFLPVPAGTRVTDSNGNLFADLTSSAEKVMVAKGGKGGRGNAHIKKSDLRSKIAEGGQSERDVWQWHESGEEVREIGLTLELKLLADVGLIGLPNAGKSTLLSKLTSATPKIAAYPFTTLEPNLGVFRHKGKELVLADIPGLIEGASEGKGLGDQFLRHVERTRLLVHLIPVDEANPLLKMSAINNELKSYSEDLADKPQIIILTKIDLLSEDDLKNKVSQFKKKNIKILPISAMSSNGLEELKDKLIRRI